MNYGASETQDSMACVLSRQITENGYAVIDDFVPRDRLAVAQDFVSRAVSENGGQYIGFTGTAKLGGTFLADLPDDPDFIGLCRGIYESAVGRPAPDVGFYQILRCLSGSTAQKHAMRFHFDSYVLTALIPVTVPDHGNPGRLIIHPNTRRIRRNYLTNLVDKALVDNPLSQTLLRSAYRRGSDRVIRLALKPGSLYFFWGYQSLHTNEACDAEAIRSTALLHYADPHADSRLKQRLRR